MVFLRESFKGLCSVIYVVQLISAIDISPRRGYGGVLPVARSLLLKAFLVSQSPRRNRNGRREDSLLLQHPMMCYSVSPCRLPAMPSAGCGSEISIAKPSQEPCRWQVRRAHGLSG